MRRILAKAEEVEDARRRLCELLDARACWFLREGRDGRVVELRRGEWELCSTASALLLAYWGEAGRRVWRVAAWASVGEALLLEASRRACAERARLELVPRARVGAAREAVAAARREECAPLAAAVCEQACVRVAERAALSAGARRGEPGRWARVVVRRERLRVAATGPVVAAGAEVAEDFLASALLWHARLEERTRDARPSRRDARGVQLWLVAPPALAAAVCERVALLREGLRALTTVFEVEVSEAADAEAGNSEVGDAEADGSEVDNSGAGDFEIDEEGRAPERLRASSVARLGARSLKRLRVPALEELLDAPAPRLLRQSSQPPSEFAERVVALAPEEVDVVRSRRGETLRFNGLPFARVRRLMGREHAWFGVGGVRSRRLLDEESAADFIKLFDELKEHRRAHASDELRADAPANARADDSDGSRADAQPRRAVSTQTRADAAGQHQANSPKRQHRADSSPRRRAVGRAHALYRAAPEAWLESLLRRDITRLDPGLRLAPLHAQFRAAHGAPAAARPVDLLAIRRDGRLVVIELKVSESATLALQGADYWRRVEQHRRAGDIARARLFDDAEVADEPPLVYLVAPALRFHRAFDTIARTISSDIEIYRFDLNEDWRAGVRVTRRARVV
jgi:hypothetical protein